MRGTPRLLAGLRRADTAHPVALAAILALLMQVLFVPPLALAMARAAADGTTAGTPICRAPGTDPGELPVPFRHDHAHCLICHVSPAMAPPPALPAVLPADVAPPPPPVRVREAAAPPGRAAAYASRAPPARA
jgi:hypothetical protein